MRTDKAKNIAKVTEVLVNNPLLTVREVADETWISKSSVANYINEDLDKIGQKSKDIIEITEKDKEAIKLAQRIIIQSLEKHVEKSEASWWLWLQEALQASWLAKESTARYSLFRWNATDEQGWMKLPDVTFQIINPNGNEEDTSKTI